MRKLIAGLVVGALATAACSGSGGTQADDGRTQVVAGFYPLAEAARRIGGRDVEVTNLTPAGTEPHDLELTPTQVDRLLDADVVVYLGDGFQPAVQEVVRRRQTPAVDLLTSVPVTSGGEGTTGRDPHFWLDPTLLSLAAGRIEAALVAARPPAADRFRVATDGYRAELAGLDAELEAGLAECQRDDIVTSHAAFQYLAKRYRLNQRPLAGLSPEAEPDPRRLAELADLIKRQGITTVFYERVVSARVARTLAAEAKVATAVLDPVESLSRRDLEQGREYADVMRDNLAALRAALDCH